MFLFSGQQEVSVSTNCPLSIVQDLSIVQITQPFISNGGKRKSSRNIHNLFEQIAKK